MTQRKLWSYVITGFFAASSFFVFLAVGCKKSPPTPKEAASQALKWNLKTTVEAYNKVGVRNFLWDDSARKCLEEFARMRAKAVKEVNQ